MSLNIPKAMLGVCSTIEAKVDLRTLGPRQIAALKRQLKTGVLKGYSVPTLIARNLRKAQGLPWFHYQRYGRLAWGNIPEDSDLWDQLITNVAAARLVEGLSPHGHSSLQGFCNTINQRTSDARYLYCPIAVEVKLKFPPAVWDESATLLPITLYEDNIQLI